MNSFETFLTKLLNNPSQETTISIFNKPRKVKGMVKLETLNMPDNPYIKITFTDGSFLLIMISDQELYFAESIVEHIQEILDEDIGIKQIIEYQGKKYQLGNKDDYQHVIQRYVGDFFDVEGEARFSDYFPNEGEKEFLSLGWLAYNGKRADINPIFLSIDDVKFLK